jgi:hypothetical protein
MKTPATNMIGRINVRRSYDVRIDPKTGQKSEASPLICMCCQKPIFNVTELENGDVVGPGCDGLIAYPAYRVGRNLTQKQINYAKSRGLL